MRAILRLVLDQESFFEMGAEYGPGQICGLARLDGQPVGVLANDCRHYAGAMTAEAAQKYRRFVELCDTFHLPIVNFVDQPGFMIGPEAERAGTIRYGMAAVAAAVQATVPWASIQVHKGFGVATAAHYGPDAYVLAWPSVESGALPLEGGVAVAFRREIESAPDPDAKRRELEASLRARRSPYARAESFSVHDLIDPRETRPMLCRWIDWIQPQLEALTGPVRFGLRP
jgi:acetyl-CoA carboxylase carboxyltransferase component